MLCFSNKHKPSWCAIEESPLRVHIYLDSYYALSCGPIIVVSPPKLSVLRVFCPCLKSK